MINAFPAAWLREEERDKPSPGPGADLDPIDQAQDWESFLVNSIAVRPTHRRQGIGTRLMEMAIEQAKVESCPPYWKRLGRQRGRPCPLRKPGF